MKKLHWISPVLATLVGAGVVALPGGSSTQEVAEPAVASEADATQAELEAAFEKMLSGAQLTGYFTDSAMPEGAPLSKDSYTISKVSKISGNVWRFDTRIQYGTRDITLPIPLEVQWAGDTPMVTMTDAPIPGLGTFTARVLFYRGQYAGIWSGADHGGELFGKIERASDPQGGTKSTGEDGRKDG